MKFLLLLLFTSSAYAETIRIKLLFPPCQPECVQRVETLFKTHSSFEKVAVLAKYREIQLEAIDFIQDWKIKEMLRQERLIVYQIIRTNN